MNNANSIMSIRDAAHYCADQFTEFPLNVESISRKLYAMAAEKSIETRTYKPEFGSETIVIERPVVDRFCNSEAFSHLVSVQRKKLQKKGGINPQMNNGLVSRYDKPVIGDVYVAPESAGFSPNSILLVTKAGNNNVLMEEITTDKAREVNNGEIISPCSFARSIAEVSQYNYFGNSYNMSIVANRMSNNQEF